ncbi:hypothetical protein HDU93_007949 [Gonapodya sp. JEL0774]|nr:hypothetical protein HDU93_007949 [Gonapodya sp. JEL0774]
MSNISAGGLVPPEPQLESAEKEESDRESPVVRKRKRTKVDRERAQNNEANRYATSVRSRRKKVRITHSGAATGAGASDVGIKRRKRDSTRKMSVDPCDDLKVVGKATSAGGEEEDMDVEVLRAAAIAQSEGSDIDMDETAYRWDSSPLYQSAERSTSPTSSAYTIESSPERGYVKSEPESERLENWPLPPAQPTPLPHAIGQHHTRSPHHSPEFKSGSRILPEPQHPAGSHVLTEIAIRSALMSRPGRGPGAPVFRTSGSPTVLSMSGTSSSPRAAPAAFRSRSPVFSNAPIIEQSNESPNVPVSSPRTALPPAQALLADTQLRPPLSRISGSPMSALNPLSLESPSGPGLSRVSAPEGLTTTDRFEAKLSATDRLISQRLHEAEIEAEVRDRIADPLTSRERMPVARGRLLAVPLAPPAQPVIPRPPTLRPVSNSTQSSRASPTVSEPDTPDDVDPSLPSCRICLRHGATTMGGFVAPCKCTGSGKFVHRACLARWIAPDPSSGPTPAGGLAWLPGHVNGAGQRVRATLRSDRTKCATCRAPYSFRTGFFDLGRNMGLASCVLAFVPSLYSYPLAFQTFLDLIVKHESNAWPSAFLGDVPLPGTPSEAMLTKGISPTLKDKSIASLRSGTESVDRLGALWDIVASFMLDSESISAGYGNRTGPGELNGARPQSSSHILRFSSIHWLPQIDGVFWFLLPFRAIIYRLVSMPLYSASLSPWFVFGLAPLLPLIPRQLGAVKWSIESAWMSMVWVEGAGESVWREIEQWATVRRTARQIGLQERRVYLDGFLVARLRYVFQLLIWAFLCHHLFSYGHAFLVPRFTVLVARYLNPASYVVGPGDTWSSVLRDMAVAGLVRHAAGCVTSFPTYVTFSIAYETRGTPWHLLALPAGILLAARTYFPAEYPVLLAPFDSSLPRYGVILTVVGASVVAAVIATTVVLLIRRRKQASKKHLQLQDPVPTGISSSNSPFHTSPPVMSASRSLSSLPDSAGDVAAISSAGPTMHPSPGTIRGTREMDVRTPRSSEIVHPMSNAVGYEDPANRFSKSSHSKQLAVSPHKETHWFYDRVATTFGDLNVQKKSAGYHGPPLRVFTPTTEDEIAVLPSQVIELRDVFSDGWGVGWNLDTGAFGVFPLDCLALNGMDPNSNSSIPSVPSRVVSKSHDTAAMVQSTRLSPPSSSRNLSNSSLASSSTSGNDGEARIQSPLVNISSPTGASNYPLQTAYAYQEDFTRQSLPKSQGR